MKQKFEKIKTHFRENKKVYIASSANLIIGLGFGYLKMNSGSLSNVAKQVVIAWKTGNITQNVVQTNLSRLGHPGNIVLCNETGEVFASQGRAALLLGINPGTLSKHLSGKLANVGGYTFTKLGEAQ